MTFIFAAICNKINKLKMLKEFRSICTCIFVRINKGTELDSLTSNLVFDLYDKLYCLFFFFFFFLRFSMIVTFTANKQTQSNLLLSSNT